MEPNENKSSINHTGPVSIVHPDSPKPVEQKSINYDDLTFLRICGKGVYGTVYEGTYKGERVAIKNMNLRPSSIRNERKRKRLIEDFQKEATLLSRLEHPNVIHFHGLAATESGFSIVTEFLDGGTLYDLIQTKPFCLTNFNIWSLATDIAKGCHYLHSVHFISSLSWIHF